jgi:hypothetical protein
MKKDSFLLEFLKSGPFLLLIIIALAVTLGVVFVNHPRAVVKMRENVIYVTPKPIK